MGFRTLEINRAAEIHIREGQLLVSNDKGNVQIPIEDLLHIVVHGANIRLSTMDLSILAKNKVQVITLDEKYLPTAIVLPFEGHSRQSKLMYAQTKFLDNQIDDIWMQIIYKKISNQARTLLILGLQNADKVAMLLEKIEVKNIDAIEALAAREYFANYHEGLKRRREDPVNSRLNYGYAVVRSAIIRSLVCTGFHPAFGIHHKNQLNSFNLADDLIEPFRAIVDLVAYENMGDNIILSKKERRNLSGVLYNVCIVKGTKVNVLEAIELMCESLKRIILGESKEELLLPTVIPLERMEGVTE